MPTSTPPYTPPAPPAWGAGVWGLLYAVVFLCGGGFLCGEVLMLQWAISTGPPLGLWHGLLAGVVLLDIGLLALPLVVKSFLHEVLYGVQIAGLVAILIFLWVVNLWVPYAAWGGICGFCYFG